MAKETAVTNVKLKNKYYQEDIDFAVRMDRWALYSVGVWPEKSKSKIETIKSWILLCQAIFILLFTTLSVALDVYTDNLTMLDFLLRCLTIIYMMMTNAKLYFFFGCKKEPHCSLFRSYY